LGIPLGIKLVSGAGLFADLASVAFSVNNEYGIQGEVNSRVWATGIADFSQLVASGITSTFAGIAAAVGTTFVGAGTTFPLAPAAGIATGFAVDYHLDEAYNGSQFRVDAIDKITDYIDYTVGAYKTVNKYWEHF
jgi:hypothetical protein